MNLEVNNKLVEESQKHYDSEGWRMEITWGKLHECFLITFNLSNKGDAIINAKKHIQCLIKNFLEVIRKLVTTLVENWLFKVRKIVNTLY